MEVTFKKLKPNRIFQDVVEQIQTAILDGSLKPGDTLPSEMKLKDMFDTSRGTIREALRILEQRGLIDVKTGVSGGAVVRPANTEAMTESLALFMQFHKVTYDQLAEFRESVEGIVASLAAERATQKDIQRLKDLVAKAARLVDEPAADWKALVHIDMLIHVSIAEISGNPVFIAVLKMVHEYILGLYERFSLKGRNILHENVEDLESIVSAIAQGKRDEAKSLAQQHVRTFNRYMKEGHQV